MKKMASGTMLTLLLVGMIALAFNIQPVKSNPQEIYITAGGAVNPPEAPITWDGEFTYTLNRDILAGEYDSIVIQRDNIVLDGLGNTFYGQEVFTGIEIEGRQNVNIRNIAVTGFGIGIGLYNSDYCRITMCDVSLNENGIFLFFSSNNIVERNTVSANNYDGIFIELSLDNVVERNTVSANGDDGIELHIDNSGNTIRRNFVWNNNDIGVSVDIDSCYNYIRTNTMRENHVAGILLRGQSNNNEIIENNIEYNHDGIQFSSADNNIIHHNNFIMGEETRSQVYDNHWDNPEIPQSTNTWDDGYPSGGNYWSDYSERYPDAQERLELDHYGIWDTYYDIYDDNIDECPLMDIYLPGDVNEDMRVDIRDIVIICVAYSAIPEGPRWDVRADIVRTYYGIIINIYDVVFCAVHYGQTYPQFPFSLS